MNFTVNTAELNKKLKLVFLAIPKRATHPILNNFKLEGRDGSLMITGFNLNQAISTYIGGEGDGFFDITLPAKEFMNIVSKIKSENIHLKVETEGDDKVFCTISSDNKKALIQGMVADDYPEIPTIEHTTEISMPLEALSNGVNFTESTSSNDETKQILVGVNIQLKPDNSLHFASTDGHRLSHYRYVYDNLDDIIDAIDVEPDTEDELIDDELDEPDTEDELIDDELVDDELEESEEVKSKEIEITLPSESLKIITKIIKEIETDNDTVTFSLGEDYFSFELEDFTVLSRVILGRFPKYHSLIPDIFQRVVQVDQQAILDSVKFIRTVETNGITILVDEKYDYLKLENKGQDQITDNVFIRNIKTTEDDLKPLLIGFNEKYFEKALELFKDFNIVSIHLNGEKNPAIITGSIYNEYYTHLIMPVQIKD